MCTSKVPDRARLAVFTTCVVHALLTHCRPIGTSAVSIALAGWGGEGGEQHIMVTKTHKKKKTKNMHLSTGRTATPPHFPGSRIQDKTSRFAGPQTLPSCTCQYPCLKDHYTSRTGAAPDKSCSWFCPDSPPGRRS